MSESWAGWHSLQSWTDPRLRCHWLGYLSVCRLSHPAQARPPPESRCTRTSRRIWTLLCYAADPARRCRWKSISRNSPADPPAPTSSQSGRQLVFEEVEARRLTETLLLLLPLCCHLSYRLSVQRAAFVRCRFSTVGATKRLVRKSRRCTGKLDSLMRSRGADESRYPYPGWAAERYLQKVVGAES